MGGGGLRVLGLLGRRWRRGDLALSSESARHRLSNRLDSLPDPRRSLLTVDVGGFSRHSSRLGGKRVVGRLRRQFRDSRLRRTGSPRSEFNRSGLHVALSTHPLDIRTGSARSRKEDEMNIGEIARRTWVPRGAISYTLSGKRSVSDGTRRCIQAVVDASGYQPDAAVRALEEGRTLGLVIPPASLRPIATQLGFVAVGICRQCAQSCRSRGWSTYPCLPSAVTATGRSNKSSTAFGWTASS